MSYYMMNYSMTNPGTPGESTAPVPGWGMNPAAAGPRRVGIGQRAAEDIEGRYKQTSWGMVAAAGAGGVALGLFLGYLAGQRKRMTPNRRRRSSQRRRRSYAANARWSTKYKNQLPDSHFAYVEPGGRKVRTKRGTFTIPKDKRKLPYVNLQGNVDKSHLLNAISRAGQKQTDIPSRQKKQIQRKLQRLYASKYGYKSGKPEQLRGAA